MKLRKGHGQSEPIISIFGGFQNDSLIIEGTKKELVQLQILGDNLQPLKYFGFSKKSAFLSFGWEDAERKAEFERP